MVVHRDLERTVEDAVAGHTKAISLPQGHVEHLSRGCHVPIRQTVIVRGESAFPCGRFLKDVITTRREFSPK